MIITMAYRFRLESVLIYRNNLEELAQQKLFGEQIILKNHIQRLEELKAERIIMIEDFEQRKKKRLSAAFFAFYMEGINAKDREIQFQNTTIESQRKVVEMAREELKEKVKDRKVIERAKERDYQKYLQEFLRKEQKESDEQAILRYGRNVQLS